MKKKLIIGTSEDDRFLVELCSKKLKEKLNNDNDIEIEVMLYEDIHPKLEADHFYMHGISIHREQEGHVQFLALKDAGLKVTASVHLEPNKDLNQGILYFEGNITEFIEKIVTENFDLKKS